MALADSVPGVSGGTIAFILGFYDDFIGSLNSLISKDGILNKIRNWLDNRYGFISSNFIFYIWWTYL